MQGKGGKHNIKAIFLKLSVFNCGAAIFHLFKMSFFPGNSKHAIGNIDADDLFCTMFCCIDAVPSVAAAEIQHCFSRKIRKERLKCFPLTCSCKTLFGAAHLTVFFKKSFFVVFVLFHDKILHTKIDLVCLAFVWDYLRLWPCMPHQPFLSIKSCKINSDKLYEVE